MKETYKTTELEGDSSRKQSAASLFGQAKKQDSLTDPVKLESAQEGAMELDEDDNDSDFNED